MNKKIYLDMHVIQSFPPSCINRDDTGSPKTALYGGVRRARISSQSWKHAMRENFKEHFDEGELSERTKKIVDKVAEKIIAKKNEEIDLETAQKVAEIVINAAGVSTKDAEAKALFFMSNQQAENLAELVIEQTDFANLNIKELKFAKKEAQEALNLGSGVDIALFGRMVADDPSLNAEAAAQVAHIISTHKSENEYDYYTALDDRSPEDQAGAGMIGTIEFNSSTCYRYATVAIHNLQDELLDVAATAKTAKEFIRAFVSAMPTGKQNTFANGTPPYAVMIAIREDQPVNLVGAFEEPVKAGEGGYLKKSTKAFVDYTESVYQDFFGKPLVTLVIGEDFKDLGKALTLPVLLDEVEQNVKQFLQHDGELS